MQGALLKRHTWPSVTLALTVVGPTVLLVALIMARIDKLSTISVATPIVIAAACLVASFVGIVSALLYWSPEPSDMRENLERLRRDRPGVWHLVGVSCVIVLAAIAAFGTARVLGVLAQHIEGNEILLSGRVVDIRPNGSARNPCLRKLFGRLDDSGEELVVCIETAFSPPIADARIKLGSSFQAEAVETPFGTAVHYIRLKR